MSESWPAPLETLTIRGAWLRRSSGSIAWVRRQAPNRLVSSVLWASSSGASAALVAVSPATPALLTSASSRPGSDSIRSRSRSTLSRIGDVELLGLERQPPAVGDLLGRPLGGGGIARGEDHVVPELRQLPRDLAPDPPIGPADQGDALITIHHRHTTPP